MRIIGSGSCFRDARQHRTLKQCRKVEFPLKRGKAQPQHSCLVQKAMGHGRDSLGVQNWGSTSTKATAEVVMWVRPIPSTEGFHFLLD